MTDFAGEAQTLVSVADAHYQLQGPLEAVDHSWRSLDVLRQAGYPAILGTGLNNHGSSAWISADWTRQPSVSRKRCPS